jgi:hypothetical protein
MLQYKVKDLSILSYFLFYSKTSSKMFTTLEKFFYRPTVSLDEDSSAQLKLISFIKELFDDILLYCEENPEPTQRLIKRDYAYVPESFNVVQARNELQNRIRNNESTKGYVNVYLTSDRVLNWVIDNRPNRP